MKKLLKITVSLILVAILLVMAMPLYALEEVSVEEMEELREENVKHFDMGDGTYKVIVYSEPVHRKDSEGKWQDIDNTLKETDNNGNVDYATGDGRIKFSGKINNGSGKIFELSENGYKISFSYTNKNVKTASADIENHKTEKSTSIFDSSEERFEKLSRVDNLTRVRYNDIEKNTDIEYEIYSNNIKESIIVNGKQDAYEYTFELKLNKLIATLNEDGSISLNDEETGEVKYTMPAPFMFDDSGAMSTDVYYTLTQSGKYKYELKVTASNEWINAKERDFPVTIDPSVNVYTTYGEAYVSSSSPNTNYKKPSNGQLPVSSTYRTFMKFEMPELPDNAYITGAELYVNFYYNSSYDYTRIGLYKVPYSWSENTITWNNSVAAHQTEENATANFSTEELSASFGATSSEPFEIPFDMTSAVRDWCAGAANNGIGIRFLSGSSNPIYFKGYNAGSTLRPRIEIAYVGMNDILAGTFFLRNAEHDTYMQLDTTSNNVDNMRMDAFDGDTNQRWIISYLHNGYFKITTPDKTKALAFGFANTLTVELNYHSDSQMWAITKNNNGYYQISPKNNTNYSIASGALLTSPNYRVVELSTSETDNSNQWILYEYAPNHSFVTQEMGNWCWIASVLNFVDCFIDIDCTQLEIAEACRGSANTINYEGNSIKITNAFNYIFGKTNLYKMVFVKNEEDRDDENHNEDSELNDRVWLPDNEIEEILSGDNPCPIILGMNAHVVLVYGCYRDQSGDLVLLIYDSTQIGTNYYSASYGEFFNNYNVVDYFLTLNYGNS